MTGLITQYLGQGLAADRPSTPDVAAGGLAIYYATDTQELSVYDSAVSGWTASIGNQAYRGALVYRSTDHTWINYTSGAVIAWDSESYDTDSIHDNTTNNSRLTVPAGVSKVRLSGHVRLTDADVGLSAYLRIQKNGTTSYIGIGSSTKNGGNFSEYWAEVTSAVLAVTPGDYFELFLLVLSDTSLTVAADASWFAMEVIE